jgi:hypothetical protein
MVTPIPPIVDYAHFDENKIFHGY